MTELSVFVLNRENCDFFSSFLSELDSEIISEISENKIVFKKPNDNFNEEIYNILSKVIFDKFSKKILIKCVNTGCKYLTKQDKYEVWKKSFKSIMKDMIDCNAEHLYRISVIKSNLKEFCENSEIICLEGFVNFRLKELEQDFEYVIEECTEDYMTELEYREFINMLKYFVSVQSPLFLSVEVIYGKKITIYADGKNVTDECAAEFNKEIFENNKGDFLLNSLISIAPKKIVIKQDKEFLNEELKKTLLGIFGDKLKIKTE